MTKDEFVYDLLCATRFDGPGYMHPLEQPRPKRRPVKAGDSDIFWSYKVKDVAESILPKEAEDEADCVRKMLAVELTYEKVDANIRRRFYEASLLWEKMWKQSEPKPKKKKDKTALSALEKTVREAFDGAISALDQSLHSTLRSISVPAVLHGKPIAAYTTEIARQLGIFKSGSLKALDKPAAYHSDDSIDMTNGERYEYLLRLLHESIKGLYEQNGVLGLHYAFVSTAARRRKLCTDSFSKMNDILENAPSTYMDRHIADSAWADALKGLSSLCSEMQSRATNMPDAPFFEVAVNVEGPPEQATQPNPQSEDSEEPPRYQRGSESERSPLNSAERKWVDNRYDGNARHDEEESISPRTALDALVQAFTKGKKGVHFVRRTFESWATRKRTRRKVNNTDMEQSLLRLYPGDENRALREAAQKETMLLLNYRGALIRYAAQRSRGAAGKQETRDRNRRLKARQNFGQK